MKTYSSAMCWAAAILGVAVGNATGAIADDTANTLFVVLPITAWITLSGRACCFGRGRTAA